MQRIQRDAATNALEEMENYLEVIHDGTMLQYILEAELCV